MAAAQPAHSAGERPRSRGCCHRSPYRLGVSPVQGGPRLRRLPAEPGAGPQAHSPPRGGLGHAAGSRRDRRANLRVFPSDQQQRCRRLRGSAEGPAQRGQAGGGQDARSIRPAPGAGAVHPAGRRSARRHRDPCPPLRGVPAYCPAERSQPQAGRPHGRPACGRHRSRRRGVPGDWPPEPQCVHHPGLRPDRQPADGYPGRLPRPAAPRRGRPAPVPDRRPGARGGAPARPGYPDRCGRVLDPSTGCGMVDPGWAGRAGRDHRRGPGSRPPGRHRVRALRHAERAGRLPAPAGSPDHDRDPADRGGGRGRGRGPGLLALPAHPGR